CANLDHIDPDDPDTAARISFENFMEMRELGLSPVPVFHIGEKIEWLLRYLDLGCPYVGLGSAKGDAKFDFYAAAWEHLTDGSGMPLVKVHAFGESTIEGL